MSIISAPGFVAFPTTTDLAISIASDDAAPLVGGLVNGVITLRNLGAEAATDVAVGFSLLPGLALEGSEATQGRLEYQAYQTVWSLPQLDPGASAEVRMRSRATLPDANVLTVAVVEEMDQTDTGFAFETVRSYGPGGETISLVSERIIPRIEPGASYSMSHTLRVRKP